MRQRNRFAQLVSKAAVVGIVGLKVRPHDKHIWSPLAQSRASIVYCSGKSSGREFKVWRDKNRPGNKDVILPLYFAQDFEKLCSTLKLDK